MMNMEPEPLPRRKGKSLMSDYRVRGPVVGVAEDGGVASGNYFHSERFLGGPPALIRG